eukprot:441756-Rhodomonas_salina.3
MSACSSDATCGRDQRQTLSFLVQRVLIVWLIVFLPGQCADKIRYLLDDYDAMIPAEEDFRKEEVDDGKDEEEEG